MFHIINQSNIRSLKVFLKFHKNLLYKNLHYYDSIILSYKCSNKKLLFPLFLFSSTEIPSIPKYCAADEQVIKKTCYYTISVVKELDDKNYRENVNLSP